MRLHSLLTRLALAVTLMAVLPGSSPLPLAATSLQSFASPISGGCYIARSGDCRIQVDPFVLNIASGQRLVGFQLLANGQVIYDFRSDVSNPPPSTGTTYAPSLVKQGFAAVCGRTYRLNLLLRDSGDSDFLNAGQTSEFTCPASFVIPRAFLPIVLKGGPGW